MTQPIIFWHRQDLRCHDLPGLAAAAATGRPIIPCYILDDENPGQWRTGAASRWWLHHSLQSLAATLSGLGGRLVLRQGEAQAVLEKLEEFLQQGISNYSQGRNHPALECTTRLSPHLHYGEISAREVWHRARSAADASPYFRIFNPVIQALQEAGISLGKDYPHPIVEHKAARENALAALASLGAP